MLQLLQSPNMDTVPCCKQAVEPEKGNKTYWPSLLITLSTMAQLITWQACLAEGISFLIWEAGAPEKKKKKKEYRAAHKNYRAWTVTRRQSEKEQSGLRDSNILLHNDNWIQSWQNTSVSRSGNPPIRQTRPTQSDQTLDLLLQSHDRYWKCLKPHSWSWWSKRNLLNNG